MKIRYLLGILALVVLCSPFTSLAQKVSPEPKFVTLESRSKTENSDNYTRAAFSFKFGINGDEALPKTRNNWDLQFGNGSTDAFHVTMATDDRSRIIDLGKYEWTDDFETPELLAYEVPTREKSVAAIVGHMYFVHTADRENDHYSLFRVEQLDPRKSVTISWKLVSDKTTR